MKYFDEDNRQMRRIVANVLLSVAVFLIGGLLGYVTHWAKTPAVQAAATTASAPAASTQKTVEWVCPMHPQIRSPVPDKCSICGMPLARTVVAEGDPRRISLSENAKALMDVQTAAVERKFVFADIRMVGKVDYDETKLSYITAWMAGRLDRLFVDYTGVPVRKGDHLVEIYSPDLVRDQQAFLRAHAARKSLKSTDAAFVRESAESMFTDTRERLRLLGLSEKQVDAIAQRGKVMDRLTIYSPIGGIVVRKQAQQFMYVKAGTPIYTIADLSKVWVRLDAYESDLAWLRYGQKVTSTTISVPSREFSGTISFIDPVLTEKTRTVRVRVNADNTDGALKPGMFVRATVRSKAAADGKVVAPDLAGKWICPMHPEVVKDRPGKCDICEMPLVRAESLGYADKVSADLAAPLVVPVSAVLRTGTRALVYVHVPDQDQPTYEMREISLGRRAGERYLVAGGLAEGERVVVRGNFRIDSERQLRNLPSMMSPREDAPAPTEDGQGAPKTVRPTPPVRAKAVPAAFCRKLTGLMEGYFTLGEALAGDDPSAAVARAKHIRKQLADVDATMLEGKDRAAWKQHASMIDGILDGLEKDGRIEKVREQFALLSQQMLVTSRLFGVEKAVFRIRCPMAFNNRGAEWLQGGQTVRNPYFGASMLGCGAVVETLKPAAAASRPAGRESREHHDHK